MNGQPNDLSQWTETPVVFSGQGQSLIGVIHTCATAEPNRLGVLVVVGGPQYRVGSHRQFVLLARHLAGQGIPTMRFDARGMGDSSGEPRDFLTLHDDISAAVDCFLATCPALAGVVLWGLCDAASAALFYAHQDTRVKGVVLLNPWLFTPHGAAKTCLKHYYGRRLLSKDFWRKVWALQFDLAGSARTLVALFRQAGQGGKGLLVAGQANQTDASLPLPVRMRECLKQFSGPVLLLLSGRDLTADEFKEAVKADLQWQALLAEPRVTRHDLADADHTFATAAWREQVAEWTLRWVKKQGV